MASNDSPKTAARNHTEESIRETVETTLGKDFLTEAINSEYLRIRTPKQLPDGTLLDIFIRPSKDGYLVTDLGESLSLVHIRIPQPEGSPEPLNTARNICKDLQVTLALGIQLETYSRDWTQLTHNILRVAEAALAIAWKYEKES